MKLLDTINSLFLRLILSVVLPALTIVGALYILNSMGDIKYLPASGFAFGMGFFFIYLAFKYLIKPGSDKEPPHMRGYCVVFIIGLIINTEIVYILVNYVDVPLLTAQTVAAVVIAYESYYAYLSLLYRDRARAVIKMPESLGDDIVYYDQFGDKAQY